ncbi:5'-nucleotidase C-terminal domain-containing protein [Pseudoruegeria sp. SK021]|uniref:5'-nucleotidase C-terminal domain-containing protein n=1 Tax=Pseudoruegeria sp. SK021 TaxID=1933035 RepID=UPI000A252FB4|nr:5'-nucleotidase C-terminal domain-containing protein [Pseudoruegeria sp. SK021]OSP56754.1 hypothetical protein BV911_02060 [Pseudoruegeria sp. SK021]
MDAPRLIRLRLLATTDLHCTIWPFDYAADRSRPGIGLAALAPLIAAARTEADNALLLDNGDFLQGTALADLFATADPAAPRHPMIAAMNALGYDAAALGNHDFNFGLAALHTALSGAEFPVLSANLVAPPTDQNPAPNRIFPATALLEREMLATDGSRHLVRIGVIGAAPPQTVEWDSAVLAGQVQACGIRAAIAAELPALRAAGADLIVALAHSGLGPPDAGDEAEDACLSLAALPGLDAIIAGHSHKVFPGPGHAARPGIDSNSGRLGNIPAVMAGAMGQYLGLIDLDLVQRGGRWRPVASQSTLRRVPDDHDAADPRLLALSLAAHNATRRNSGAVLGESLTRLHGVFALAAHSPALQFTAEAQLWRARQLVADLPEAALPLLTAVSPYRAGGHAGGDAYTDIPAGPLRMGHLTELSPFPNHLDVVAVTGAQIRAWLDRSAALFQTIAPGARDVPLLMPDAPCYNFDQIYGLRYRIDLSQPPRYRATDGRRLDTSPPSRIRDLTLNGRPLGPEDRVLVATTSYRTAGGGNFDMVRTAPVIARSDASLRENLTAYTRAANPIQIQLTPVWGFSPLGATALFHGPQHGSLQSHGDPDRLIEALDLQPNGGRQFRLFL